jgi:signal transduction histidine kinase
MTPPVPDERLQRALERFVAQGFPFILPEGTPPAALLPAPPGGLPPDTRAHAALPTPPLLPHPPHRDVSALTPFPVRKNRAVADLTAVLSSLDHVIWSASPDGRVVLLLAGAVERLLSAPAESFLSTPDAWTRAVPEDDHPAIRAAFAQVAETGSFVVEHRVRGRERRVVSRGQLVRRPDGTPARVDGTTAEVVESAVEQELRTKLAAAEDRLKGIGRLETLGRLVTGVAHDFNNCLTVISGNAQLIRELLPAGDPLRDRAGEIVSHVGSAAAVARQLVSLGRPIPADTGPTDPNAEIRGLERLLRRVTGEAIEFDVLLAPAVHPIPVGAGAFVQVVLNLVANARDAIPGRGAVTLRTAEAVVSASRPGWPTGLRAGRYMAVTVTDTGVGMSDAVRARMFEPYFTTKGEAGNGVGLATVAEVVRTAGGHVEVESAEGWGTSVRVYFPPATGPAPVAPPVTPPPRPGRETVLLVQDATAVRDLTAVALQHAGYRVLEADDGAAGEKRARLYAGPIDLLVTDVGLPRLDGPELAAAMRATRPGLKVLYLSGNAPRSTDGAFLAKPYGMPDLLNAVRQVLDGA